MNPLLELADRVEAATGPDRNIDCWIENHLDRARFERNRPAPHGGGWLDKRVEPKPFTASLDAAMTLVPEGWDWSTSGYGEDGASAEVWLHGWQDDTKINSFLAPTSPLCLVVASLRAIASMGSSG